jgi:hypothetical protein
MKKQLTILVLLFVSLTTFAQETTFKEYSYTEFFNMIEKEQDTIFKLRDAIIGFNEKTDSAFIAKTPFMAPAEPYIKSAKIIIDKAIRLENVHFSVIFESIKDSNSTGFNPYSKGVIHNVHFKKSVVLTTCMGFELFNSVFDQRLIINNNNICSKNEAFFKAKKITRGISLGNNVFKKDFRIFTNCDNTETEFYYGVFMNTFNDFKENPDTKQSNGIQITITNALNFTFFKNKLYGDKFVSIRINDTERIVISENDFNAVQPIINLEGTHSNLVFNKNKFTSTLQLGVTNLSPSDVFEWNQFKSNFYSFKAFENLVNLLPDEEYFKTDTDSFRSLYQEKIRFQNAEVYAGEAALKGTLYRHYRENFDMVRANDVFMNLKDFETERLAYLYEANPSFDTFFTWKVNQFLKEFSNYGTKPSKAITFSVYVVFVFALIYLFFPNSWDRHGKNRIINRYKFFTKYMNQKSGIHEVYLDDQKDELLEYHEFKNYMESNVKTIPKFFTVTALPLYKWAISGTKLSASFLKRIDIMQGSWQELPAHKRFWKSILLIGAFLFAILYDIFIKILNALMLSINTFTTLGFGEIPIKGLPRYLAIIQGFIGWFMLTIFSVSLISQLLN